MKKSKILYFVLFAFAVFISYHLSIKYQYHWYEIHQSNTLKFLVLFLLQGITTYFAVNSLFIKKHKNVALLLNSCIIYFCFVFIFVMETLYATPRDTPLEFVINSVLDPYMLLLHFVYCFIFYMLFKHYNLLEQLKKQLVQINKFTSAYIDKWMQ